MSAIHDVCLISVIDDGWNLGVSLVAHFVMTSSCPNVGVRGIAWSFVVVDNTSAIAGKCGLLTLHIPALMREHPWKSGVLASGFRVQAGTRTVMTMDCHAGRVLI
jgi:hypothetical protein